MRRIVFLCLFLATLAVPTVGRAHFLWLVTETRPGANQVTVYFGEAAEPDDPGLLDKVAAAEVWSLDGRGQPQSLTLRKSGETLSAELPSPTTTILRHNYGVVAKGGESFLLKYYAKSYPYPLPGTWRAVEDKERLPLEIVPRTTANGVSFTVTWNGQPQAGATVTVVGPGVESKSEGNTNEAGVYSCRLPQAGRYSIRAKHVESTTGALDGKDYKSVRHYSTLTLNHVPAELTPVAHDLPALPKGTTSFGGAIAGDLLFVYGGNYGSAHEYANDDQSGDLWKLDLKKPGAWQQLSGGAKLQGLAMVEHGGRLYRVGGFTATNRSGEKQNLVSQADFACFDPQSKTWQTLPSLPEPRSSHDAAVIGDTLYVVGGWNMQGGGPATRWHDTVLAMNLAAEKLEWRTVAAPSFKRRALAIAAWRGKLFCVGGMSESGGPTTAVTVYDPAQDRWSEGPAILGPAMDGFGSSAFACQDALYVTTVSGSIQRLRGAAQQWEYVGQLAHARFFHRLLPWRDSKLIVVGGANMEEGKTESIELLDLGAARTAAK